MIQMDEQTKAQLRACLLDQPVGTVLLTDELPASHFDGTQMRHFVRVRVLASDNVSGYVVQRENADGAWLDTAAEFEFPA